MQDATTIVEFVKLWFLVQDIQLNDQPDEITWKWTANGKSEKSAYLVQCHGSYSQFDTTVIWKAKAEGKQKLHTWLALQDGLPTADNLGIRNWPCNETCVLCDQEPETINHISLKCSFAKQVAWNKLMGASADRTTGGRNKRLTGMVEWTHATRKFGAKKKTSNNCHIHPVELMEGEEQEDIPASSDTTTPSRMHD